MRKNLIPVVIAFSSGLLLPLIQDVVRPRIIHSGLLAFVLSCAVDFVVGFCFPFSILIKPRVWTNRGAAKLFALWSALTVVALLLDEYLSPLRTQRVRCKRHCCGHCWCHAGVTSVLRVSPGAVDVRRQKRGPGQLNLLLPVAC